jgi:hypothetical protein
MFQNLAQQGVLLIKRKICQNLHECGFLSTDETLNLLNQFIIDPNEYSFCKNLDTFDRMQ